MKTSQTIEEKNVEKMEAQVASATASGWTIRRTSPAAWYRIIVMLKRTLEESSFQRDAGSS
jgi:hypothetical protein